MKISKILLVFLLALSIVGCKNDDDGVVAFTFNQANLLGTHELIFYQSTEVETVNINGLDIVTTTTTVGDTFEMDFEFRENGTVLIDGAYRQMYTVVVAGQVVDEDSDIIVVSNETSNYTASSGASTLTLDGDVYQVTAFNETSMTILLEETTDVNGVVTVSTEELRFTRI